MTEFQRLFHVQARSDFSVFNLLRKLEEIPSCHVLHYLQMATEKLGKAYIWKNGYPGKETHRAFVPFLKSLFYNRKAQKELGYERKNDSWKNLIHKSMPLAQMVENLAPQLAVERPNPEYPWPPMAPHTAPAEHDFHVWQELQAGNGRQFLKLIKDLFANASAFL